MRTCWACPTTQPQVDNFSFGLEVYGFVDHGRTFNLDGGTPTHITLMSGGGGLRFKFDPGIKLQIDAAVPLSEPRSQTESAARITANLTVAF